MSSYAFFDISTTKNKGILDADINDVLIRCLEPSQRFLIGLTGNESAVAIDTEGNVDVNKSLSTPLILTNRLEGEGLTLGSGVKVNQDSLTFRRAVASNITCSNLVVGQGGWTDAGDFLTASDYIEAPHVFLDVITKGTDNGQNILFTNDVSVQSNLNVSSSITVTDLTASNNIFAKTINVSSNLSVPSTVTKQVSSLDGSIKVQNVIVNDANIIGNDVSFSNALIRSSRSSNIFTSNLESGFIRVARLNGFNDQAIDIESVSVRKGVVSCTQSVVSDSLSVSGLSMFANDVSLNKTLVVKGGIETNANLKVATAIACNTLNAGSEIVTPRIRTSLIDSPNNNLYFANSGMYLLDSSNLYTTNAFFIMTKSSNVEGKEAVFENLQVKSIIRTGDSISASNSISTPNIYTQNISSEQNVLSLNRVQISGSNLTLSGVANLSNIVVKERALFDDGSSILARCPLEITGKITCFDEIQCFRQVSVPQLNVTNILSVGSNSPLCLDGVSIQNKSNLYARSLTSEVLNASEASIAKLNVTTSCEVKCDINCTKTVFTNLIKGYTVPGSLFIEGVSVFDNDKIALNTLNAKIINVSDGRIVLSDTASLVKSSGLVVIDVNGKISGSNIIIANSINTQCLANNIITSEKIATNAIQSTHLSSGLTFTGTCRFDNIDLTGSFLTTNNSMSVCGVAFTSSSVGIGGIETPEYPLHVKGKMFITDDNVRFFVGMSNNMGIAYIHSTDINSPVGLKMTYSNVSKVEFNLATYPSCFGIANAEQGDLIIKNTNADGSVSKKIFLNEYIVCSSSNVGVFRQNPLAAFHTTVIAADKIGLGGITKPIETVDIVGNIRVTRDQNSPTTYLRLLDVSNQGGQITLSPFDSDKKLSVYNAIGDITISAKDQDPSTCEHLRIQSISGYIGLGTSNPLCPLHISSFVRPGATTPPQTILLQSEEPSVLFSNTSNASFNFRMNRAGQLFFSHSIVNPSCRLIGTNRVFTRNENVIPGANDNNMEIAPYTRVVLFTEQNQMGNYEVLTNSNATLNTVPLSGLQRKLNWTVSLNSLSVSSFNTTVSVVRADMHFVDNVTNVGNSNVLYINTALRLIGLGTSTPSAAIDIHSSLSSNVMAIKGTTILDTNFNLSNINRLAIKGPFFINGRQFFDNSNNIVGVTNINGLNSIDVGRIFLSNDITKNNKVVLDTAFNLSNIELFSLKGPIILSGKNVLDTSWNLSNINAFSLQGPVNINGNLFVDSNRNVTCSNISATNKIYAKNSFVLGDNGEIADNSNIRVLSKTNVEFVNRDDLTKVLDLDTLAKDVKIFGALSLRDKVVLTNSYSLSNISSVFMNGPLVVRGSTILSQELDLDVRNINMRGPLSQRGVTLITETGALSNISSLSLQAPIFVQGMTLLDQNFNLRAICSIDVSSNVTAQYVNISCNLNLQSAFVSCSNMSELYVKCSAFKVDVSGRAMMNCVASGSILCDADVEMNSLKTSVIDVDDYDKDLLILTRTNRFVNTNVAFKSPKFIFGSSGFSISDREAGSVLQVQKQDNILLDLTSTTSSFKTNVIIKNPTETGYELAVGGTIYADGDMFTFSDERKKKNVRVIKNALSKLCQLRGVVYERTDMDEHREFTGVIAQDVERVLPQAINRDSKSGYLSVAYGNLIGLLIESIKELESQTKIKRKRSIKLPCYKHKKCIGISSTSKNKLLKANKPQ